MVPVTFGQVDDSISFCFWMPAVSKEAAHHLLIGLSYDVLVRVLENLINSQIGEMNPPRPESIEYHVEMRE